MTKTKDIFFCKKCVMSNQKVLPSVLTSDTASHENRSNISFVDGVCAACIEVEKNTPQLIGLRENLNLINF